jgi:hypothetical protein
VSRRKNITYILLAGAVLVALYYFYGGSTVPKGQPALVRLNSSSIASLKHEFNASSQSIRMLVLLSPT